MTSESAGGQYHLELEDTEDMLEALPVEDTEAENMDKTGEEDKVFLGTEIGHLRHIITKGHRKKKENDKNSR
jgi:hypothetical protein